MTGLAAQINEGVTAATGNSTAGSFLQQGLLTAAYNIKGGKGFKDDYSSLNWGVFNPGASQLGSILGGMASQHLKEQSKSRMPETPGDPLGTVDNLLGGMWYGMRKLEESVSNMYTSVLETTGLGNVIDTVNSWAETSRSIFGVAGNVMTNIGGAIGAGIMGTVNTVTTAAGNFLERTGNWITGDGFNTDDEVVEIQARKRIQEAIKNGLALEEGSEEYKRMEAALNKKLNDLDQQLNGGGKAVPETANSKAVQIIKDKLASGQNVSDADLEAFFASSEMKSVARTEKEGKASELEKELIATIKNDPKAFEEAMNARSLDPNKPEDVQQFSRTMQAGFCVLFSEYAQMALNNVNGTAPSVGEFYKDLLNGKSINGGKLIDILSQKVSTQEIFDSVAGAGNVDVVGYGKDRNGKGFKDGDTDNGNYSGSDMMTILKKLAKSGSADYFTVRINTEGNHFHNVTVKNINGDLRLYDNSYRGYNQSYKNYSNYLNKRTIQSFYYLR